MMTIGFSENEFVLARSYSRNVNIVTDQANGIIAGKNREIAAAQRSIARLTSALADERRRSTGLLRQILGAAAQ
jgi:hypothetical protein